MYFFPFFFTTIIIIFQAFTDLHKLSLRWLLALPVCLPWERGRTVTGNNKYLKWTQPAYSGNCARFWITVLLIHSIVEELKKNHREKKNTIRKSICVFDSSSWCRQRYRCPVYFFIHLNLNEWKIERQYICWVLNTWSLANVCMHAYHRPGLYVYQSTTSSRGECAPQLNLSSMNDKSETIYK